MPILDIEVVLDPGEDLPAGAARALADKAGDIFGAQAGGTWVKLRPLSKEQYAESGGTPPEVRPVFVAVLLREEPPVEDKRRWARELAEAAAPLLGRAVQNIHVLFLPPGKGRAAFGGRLME